MAAPSPRVSLARLEANRRNAQRSTGPRTEAGKARARANAVKHGLTGAGIALPTEDAAAVEATFRVMHDEMAPQTLAGAFLAQQMALAMVRCRRAALAEAAALSARVEEAPRAFDEARGDRADALFATLATNPAVVRRKLMATPEGVDRLIVALLELRDGLDQAVFAWDAHRHRRLAALSGYRERDFAGVRCHALSLAILGQSTFLDEAEVEHLESPDERAGWACAQLVEALDAELDHLCQHRETLDHAAVARARAGAARAAMVDAGQDAARARKYEAESRRAFSHALRDFGRAEALAAPEPEQLSEIAPEPGPELAPGAEGRPEPSPPSELVPEAGATPPGPESDDRNRDPHNDLPEGLGSFWRAPSGPILPPGPAPNWPRRLASGDEAAAVQLETPPIRPARPGAAAGAAHP